MWILPRICIFEFTKAVLVFSVHIFFTSPLKDKILPCFHSIGESTETHGVYMNCAKTSTHPFSQCFHSLIVSIDAQKFQFFNWFIDFNWGLISLQYCGGFCCTLTWISHRCTVSTLSRPSHLPPHPIPLGCPSAASLSALFHASNSDRWSVSHMVIYMFQCYSLKSSHPRLLPQSPKVCFYICVSQIISPGWMHETSAQAWCNGKTQRNRVEMEVEVGIRMGNTCNSMADSCECMTKTTTIL